MKIGILGYGYMGTIRHRVLGERDDCEVVRIFHTEPTAPRFTKSWEEVVDDLAIDCVFVCLPNHLIAEVTCRALLAGKHVFAEKPPGISSAEVRRMIAAEEASGRTLMFGFNLRYHPAICVVRRLVRSEELGSIVWMRGVYGKPMAHDFRSSWRADVAQAGGGILIDQGIHLLDLLQILSGDFVDVRALAASRVPGTVEDDVMIVLRSSRGALASLHSSHAQSPPKFSLEIGLTRGAARVEGLLTRSSRYGPERVEWGPLDAPRAHEETFRADDSWALEIEELFRAARAGRPPEEGSSRDALDLMLLVERIYAEAGIARGLR
jgi:1,5-anhydro-D-fructose reductase (1,5-anhydro-D-mannitol-forming)